MNDPPPKPATIAKRILINLAASAAVLLACLACLRLDTLWPFNLPEIPGAIVWFFLIAGLSLIAFAEGSFVVRSGASGALADPTRHLVVVGIYRWVRNPIYLGGALVLLGVAASGRSPTLLLAACLYLPVMHFAVVPKEETRLERDFGSDYLEYQRKTPRWIPRPPK